MFLAKQIIKKMKYIQLAFAALLLLCLADMPYGYYQLVRFIAMVLFGWMAYDYSTKEQQFGLVTFGSLALLFQPFFKIAFGRTIWNIVDVVVAIVLIVVVMYNIKSK